MCVQVSMTGKHMILKIQNFAQFIAVLCLSIQKLLLDLLSGNRRPGLLLQFASVIQTKNCAIRFILLIGKFLRSNHPVSHTCEIVGACFVLFERDDKKTNAVAHFVAIIISNNSSSNRNTNSNTYTVTNNNSDHLTINCTNSHPNKFTYTAADWNSDPVCFWFAHFQTYNMGVFFRPVGKLIATMKDFQRTGSSHEHVVIPKEEFINRNFLKWLFLFALEFKGFKFVPTKFQKFFFVGNTFYTIKNFVIWSKKV